MAQAIITRDSDGLRFEPCFHPGMVRCEACLELVEPSQVREHVCIEWWNERMSVSTPVGRGVLGRYNAPNKILRQHRK